MRTALVPLDSSRLAERALGAVRRLVARDGPDIVLLHVIAPGTLSTWTGWFGLDPAGRGPCSAAGPHGISRRSASDSRAAASAPGS
jgi:hypothetical protein